MIIGKIMRNSYKSLSNIKRIIVATIKAPKLVGEKSYFPELKRKSAFTRLIENILWALKYGEANSFYNLYGLDVKAFRNSNDYCDYYSFMMSRNEINKVNDEWSYIALLRDKLLFYNTMTVNHYPSPEVFAVIKDNKLYDTCMRSLDWDTLVDKKDYFIKGIDGECASFVKHISDYKEFLENKEDLLKGGFILQKRIFQNKEMNSINPEAINTLRIITINKNGNPYVLTSLLRVGTKASGNVDNWAAGGLAIGIENNGFLKKYGFYKPQYGTKTTKHPDTNVIFNSFKVPLFNEAKELACNAHRVFYGIQAIGWDVALTDEGPVMIEGNDNFEISLLQACDRPLKADWKKACL